MKGTPFYWMVSSLQCYQQWQQVCVELVINNYQLTISLIFIGLGTIIFSLDIDSNSLNTPLKTVDAPIDPAPLPLEPTPTPKVVVPSPIPPPSNHTHFGTRLGDHALHEEDDVVAVRKERKKKKKTKATPTHTGPTHNGGGNTPGNNSTNHTSPSLDTLTHKDHTHTGYHDNLNPFSDGTSLCSTPSVNSLNSMCEEGVVLFNAPSVPSKPPSKDAVEIESQAAIESTSMVLAATGEHQQHPSCEGEGTVVMTTVSDWDRPDMCSHIISHLIIIV